MAGQNLGSLFSQLKLDDAVKQESSRSRDALKSLELRFGHYYNEVEEEEEEEEEEEGGEEDVKKERLKNLLTAKLNSNILSLRLVGLTPTDFNGCIKAILNTMQHLKKLEVVITCSKSEFQLDDHVWPEDAVFGLESLKIDTGNACGVEIMDEVDSVFLKQCPHLKTLSIELDTIGGPINNESTRPEIPKWFQDFENPEYPRDLQVLSLRWNRGVKTESNTLIADFVNLFPKLEDLRIQLSPVKVDYDIIQILADIKLMGVKKLVINMTRVLSGGVHWSKISELLLVLGQPQFQVLEDLMVGVVVNDEVSLMNVIPSERSASSRKPRLLSSIRRFTVKVVSAYANVCSVQYIAGEELSRALLEIAPVAMPGLESLTTDMFAAGGLMSMFSTATRFENLKELTLIGGQDWDAYEQYDEYGGDGSGLMTPKQREPKLKTTLSSLKKLEILTLKDLWTLEPMIVSDFELLLRRLPKLRVFSINEGENVTRVLQAKRKLNGCNVNVKSFTAQDNYDWDDIVRV